MGAPVWGTFSVRDHCRREAFLREVLLFDRLVVPYPDPNVQGERDRWRTPNKSDPDETWDPDRLDALLAILGTESSPGYNGARAVRRLLWSDRVWADLRSRAVAAEVVTGDPFTDTRLGMVLARGEQLPGVVEAVAAYPGEDEWRREIEPLSQPPGDLTYAEALIRLSRPLLIPEPGVDELDTLRRAVDLAMSDEYERMRAAYHDWFRNLLEPLRSPDTTSPVDLRIDIESMKYAAAELRDLWAQEQSVVRRFCRDRIWSRVEVGCVTLGVAGTVGLASVAALPAVGAGVALLGFTGWALNRWRAQRPARSLGGGAMFVTAQQRLGFIDPFPAR